MKKRTIEEERRKNEKKIHTTASKTFSSINLGCPSCRVHTVPSKLNNCFYPKKKKMISLIL
jgi:hypothetical protein